MESNGLWRFCKENRVFGGFCLGVCVRLRAYHQLQKNPVYLPFENSMLSKFFVHHFFEYIFIAQVSLFLYILKIIPFRHSKHVLKKI